MLLEWMGGLNQFSESFHYITLLLLNVGEHVQETGRDWLLGAAESQ